MIESVEFKNFKVLQDATLPLGPLTLIVGPNGSGKSTALQGLQAFRTRSNARFEEIATLGSQGLVSITITWQENTSKLRAITEWRETGHCEFRREATKGCPDPDGYLTRLEGTLARLAVFSFSASAATQPVHLTPSTTLGSNGSGLAGVLDRLRDTHPERFESLNEALTSWLPEFDRVLFDTPEPGFRAFLLRTREGRHQIRARDLSEGTLLALTLMTLAYLPEPPAIICIEEPDRAIHPRLLRRVQDALYRLAYPDSAMENRSPVQVIATTHNPYFLELFRDHPEEVVIASKRGHEATFERLSDRHDIEDLLEGVHLGEIWYSGILGGVPANV